jgi:predicted nucleic acid-binding protein
MTVGAHDLLIAVTARAVGFTVATRDDRSFPIFQGCLSCDGKGEVGQHHRITPT